MRTENLIAQGGGNLKRFQCGSSHLWLLDEYIYKMKNDAGNKD